MPARRWQPQPQWDVGLQRQAGATTKAPSELRQGTAPSEVMHVELKEIGVEETWEEAVYWETWALCVAQHVGVNVPNDQWHFLFRRHIELWV